MKNNERGQILLITVMLIATVITVVMTAVFKSTTETQITKLEQESERALVAAESALEIALKSGVGSYSTLGLTGVAGIDLVNSSVTLDDVSVAKDFVSPLVQQDEQYTFYFTGYNNATHVFDSNYYNGTVVFYFASEANSNSCAGQRTAPALEVTLISATNTIVRRLIDPCSGIGTDITADQITGDYKVLDATFKYKADSAISVNNTKVIIVRSFFNDTKIGINNNNSATVFLRPQGNYYVSEAKTYSGIVKKIRLFQAYPQIPAEFFVTSF